MKVQSRGSARLAELDGLRGVAAVSVMLFHLTYYYDAQGLAPFSVPNGHYGVELFFVISGLVIFMTLQRSPNLLRFALSRIARLYPAYWSAVLLTASFAFSLEAMPPSLGQIIVNLTMVQAYFGIPNVDSSYWTLTLELQFYIIMALIFELKLLRQINILILFYLFASHSYRMAIFIKLCEPVPSYIGILYYGNFFILGICLWQLQTRHSSWLTYAVLTLAILYAGWGSGPRSLSVGGLPYISITCVIVSVVWLALNGYARVLSWRPLVMIGTISYPLYLIHQRVGTLVMTSLYEHGLTGSVAFIIAVLVIAVSAVAIHIAVEQPGRKAILFTSSGAERLPLAPMNIERLLR